MYEVVKNAQWGTGQYPWVICVDGEPCCAPYWATYSYRTERDALDAIRENATSS